MKIRSLELSCAPFSPSGRVVCYTCPASLSTAMKPSGCPCTVHISVGFGKNLHCVALLASLDHLILKASRTAHYGRVFRYKEPLYIISRDSSINMLFYMGSKQAFLASVSHLCTPMWGGNIAIASVLHTQVAAAHHKKKIKESTCCIQEAFTAYAGRGYKAS